MECAEIINRIAEKGGMLGTCAKQLLHNEKGATKFIVECSDYCSNPEMVKFWGQSLTDDIEKFAEDQRIKFNANNKKSVNRE